MVIDMNVQLMNGLICMSRYVHIASIVYVTWHEHKLEYLHFICTGTSRIMGVCAWLL